MPRRGCKKGSMNKRCKLAVIVLLGVISDLDHGQTLRFAAVVVGVHCAERCIRSGDISASAWEQGNGTQPCHIRVLHFF